MQTKPKIFFGILLLSFFSFPLRVYSQWQPVCTFPQSLKDEVVLDSSDCENMLERLHSISQANLYQQMYDSSQFVIEHCAKYIGSYSLKYGIPKVFPLASDGCGGKSEDIHRWPPYREWLKKVLYYRTDSIYYCEDVVQILGTVENYFNDKRGADYNTAAAILKLLVDSNRCSSFFYKKDFGLAWYDIRRTQRLNWQDTQINQPLSSLDTTLPSLEEVDLEILRGPQYAAVKTAFTPSTASKITYFTTSQNPFTDETTLRFGLLDAEYMKIEIFDLLGNNLYTENKLFSDKDSHWKIDGKQLPHGGLYARLSTLGGEVSTIKLSKE